MTIDVFVTDRKRFPCVSPAFFDTFFIVEMKVKTRDAHILSGE